MQNDSAEEFVNGDNVLKSIIDYSFVVNSVSWLVETEIIRDTGIIIKLAILF